MSLDISCCMVWLYLVLINWSFLKLKLSFCNNLEILQQLNQIENQQTLKFWKKEFVCFHCLDKIPKQNKLKKLGLILAHFHRFLSIMVERACQNRFHHNLVASNHNRYWMAAYGMMLPHTRDLSSLFSQFSLEILPVPPRTVLG